MSEHRRRPPEADHRPPEQSGGGEWHVTEYGGGSGRRRLPAVPPQTPRAEPNRHQAPSGNGNGRPAASATFGPPTVYGRGGESAPPVRRPRTKMGQFARERMPYGNGRGNGLPPGVGAPGAPGGPGGPGGPVGPGGPGGPPRRRYGSPQPPPPPGRWRLINYPQRGKRGIRRWLPSWKLVSGLALACVMSLMLAFVVIYQRIELPDEKAGFLSKQASLIYWTDGTEMARLGETYREEITINEMPPHLQEAIIAAENRTFRTDRGFSVTGITRAVINNLRGGDVQGGSTITQQYAKLAYTNAEQTISRKVEELFLAMKLEETYTKEQILQFYLNAVYLGRGAHGVQAAADVYFGKEAADLTIEESAVLAAVLRNPEGLYSADKSDQTRANMQARWGWVLDQMVSTGYLDPNLRAGMQFPAIKEREQRNRKAGTNGYLIAAVERELKAAGLDDETIQNGGLRIYTTIDPAMQQAAVAAVEANVQEENAENIHVALVSVEPGTGAIRASYGGKDYLEDTFDDALQAKKQPGSTFKAFGVAAALSEENNLSLERNAFDGNSPYRFRDDSEPVNNCCDGAGGSYGQVNLLEATERSINTAFVNMSTQIGTDDVVAAAQAAGLTGALDANARTVIGIYDQKPVDMANGYATFAAGGVVAPAHIIDRAFYPDGGVVQLGTVVDGQIVPRPQPQHVFSEQQAAGVQHALRQPVEGNHGTSVKARALGRPVAGKTGTHEDLTAWFIGFTPNQLATAVLIYRDDRDDSNGKEALDGYGGRRSVTGGSFPLDTWLTYMSTVLEGMPVTDFLPYNDFDKVVDYPFPKPTPTETPPGPPNPGNGNNNGNGNGNDNPSPQPSATSDPDNN